METMLQVLGGDAVIPDYFHPDTSGWLENILTDYRFSYVDITYIDISLTSSKSCSCVCCAEPFSSYNIVMVDELKVHMI